MAAKAFAALFAVISAVTGAQAAGPQLPCAKSEAMTVHARPSASPTVPIWRAGQLGQWRPPVCTGWSPSLRAKLIVTLSGTFRFDGSMNDLLARAGQISQLPEITYWSPEDNTWMPLARRASALTAPDAKDRRDDFSAAELKPGAQLYYWENDRATGNTIYDLKVHERSAERVVMGTDNVTPVRKFVFTLFEPGALRSVLLLQRLSPGLYRADILSGALEGTSSLADGHEQTYVGRARAIYRFLAATKATRPDAALSLAQRE
jgi:hypothetical protein